MVMIGMFRGRAQNGTESCGWTKLGLWFIGLTDTSFRIFRLVIREDLIIETTFVRRFTFDIGRDGVIQNISPIFLSQYNFNFSPFFSNVQKKRSSFKKTSCVNSKGIHNDICFAGIEKLWEKVEEGYQSLRGKPPPQEVDPASLVGTFSRYKN